MPRKPKKTRPANKKPPYPRIFLLSHGTYANETIVAIGAAMPEVIRYAKRIGAKKDAVAWLETCHKEDLENHTTPSESGYIREAPAGGYTLMWLKPFEDCWEFWETLIHELSHLVDFVLSDQKRMAKETEARAYQIEYLFRQVRRKLKPPV